MDQASFNEAVLLFGLAGMGSGSVLLVTLTKHPRRLRHAAIAGALTASVVVAASIDMAESSPMAAPFIWIPSSALVGALLGIGLSAAVIGLLKILPNRWLFFRGRFESVLAPARWERSERHEEPLPDIAIARRWFVAIASGTGGVVGALIGTGTFWRALVDSFTFGGILAAALMTLVSVVLVGPFQDYVLEKRERHLESPEGPEQKLSDLVTGKASARAWLRLGLVWTLMLALELTYNSLDNSLRAGKADVFTLVLLAGITPAIVSFYWSAALQHGDRPLAKRTFVASTTACSVLWLPLCAALIWTTPPNPAYGCAYVLAPLIFALPIGFATCGVYAVLGGWVLDRFRGASGMTYLALALLAGTIVQLLFSIALATMEEGLTLDPSSAFSLFGIAAGWMFGLVASGFPALMREPLPALGSPAAVP